MPTTLTSRVITSSTSAAYISAPTSTLPASGKWLASSAASVLAGENSDQLTTFALPASMASAIVSPERAAEAEDDRAEDARSRRSGTITARIASQRVAPRPNAASRIFGGTATSASREMAEIVGSTMIASTSAAGSKPGPLRAVPKNGIQPRCPCSQSASGRTNGMTTKIPHSP